jgi:hypothetical protein
MNLYKYLASLYICSKSKQKQESAPTLVFQDSSYTTCISLGTPSSSQHISSPSMHLNQDYRKQVRHTLLTLHRSCICPTKIVQTSGRSRTTTVDGWLASFSDYPPQPGALTVRLSSTDLVICNIEKPSS